MNATELPVVVLPAVVGVTAAFWLIWSAGFSVELAAAGNTIAGAALWPGGSSALG